MVARLTCVVWSGSKGSLMEIINKMGMMDERNLVPYCLGYGVIHAI
jgi:hypothetical protein